MPVWVTEVAGLDSPHAAHVTRTRHDGYGQLIGKEIVHAVSSLSPGRNSPAGLAAIAHGQWGIESVHWLRDTTWQKTRTRPTRARDALSHLAIDRWPSSSRGSRSVVRTMYLRVVSDGGGVLERRFEALSPGGGRVPGLMWSPSGRTGTAAPMATVLIGHGRTSHKRNPYILSLARRFAACGWQSVAIDAPGHGERRAPDAEPEWPQPDADETIRDWRAALGLLQEEAGLDDARLAYWGMSMGASLGISLVAGDPRFQAAVLGLMHPNWPAPPGTRIRADAQRLECPVLFLVNWDDTRAPREAAFELFDLISSEDKRLHAYPGEHGQLPEEARAASEEFLARYLA